jgi:hypothetical protein
MLLSKSIVIHTYHVENIYVIIFESQINLEEK